MTRDKDVVARILERVAAVARAGGRRAAVFGEPADPWVDALRSHGFEVEAPFNPASPDPPDERLDLIVADGALDRVPWDRWALQQAHRALRTGGTLVVAVPSFHALTSPSDLAFLAKRVLRELAARLRRALGRAPERERFTGRRYRRAALEAMLVSLGYAVEQRSSHGHGWFAPLAGVAAGLVRRFARTHVVVARREPSLFGCDARSYPDPAAHRAVFARAHRRYLEDRERWIAEHPRFRPEHAQAFDPSVHAGANVLVLAPHPDDELIGCGGTLARLIAAGARVTVVQATDGSEAASLWHAPDAVRRTVRLEEAVRVGHLMGFEEVIFWREDNAAFRASAARVGELVTLLDRLRPSLVFVPFVTDVHPDHRTLSRMLARAMGAAAPVPEASRVLGYQVWSLVPANLYCDVTGEMELLERALWLYETAMKVDDYVHFCQDRDFHDAIALTGRPGFVEAYFATSARAYPELVAAAEGSDG